MNFGKRRTMKKLFILLLVSTTMLIAQTKVGSTAAPFLTIGVGARPISLGEAFVATANDVTALYWNPAGAARAGTNEVMFTYTQWFAGISYDWVGAMVNLGDIGSVGLSLTYLNYGEIEVTTVTEPEGTGEMSHYSDMSLGLSYGYNLTDRFSLGINLKYINQQYYHESASGVAIDVGTLFTSDIYGLRIGATISNFGGDMQLEGKDLSVLHDPDETISGNNDQRIAQWLTDAYPLPLIFRVGFAKDFMITDMNRLTLGVDATHPTDNAEYVNLGAEYSFNENIMLRAGYSTLFLDNSEQGLTLGFGLKTEFSKNFLVAVDYCWQDFGILSNTQHFSVSTRF